MPGVTPRHVPDSDIVPIRRALLQWFSKEARSLPWRTTPRDPYLVWVSEVMLQQTRVSTVIPYFHRFMERFPSVKHLAHADLDEVLSMWSGLGYYRRARAMHAAARLVVERHAGVFPDDSSGLPGIGPYTAAAIGSLAFGRSVAVLDGNVHRVLSRLTGCELPVGSSKAAKWARSEAQRLLDEQSPGPFNEAMMELGALVCGPSVPDCSSCPLLPWCRANQEGTTAKLPVMAPKKSPTAVRMTALLITWGRRVLLARRKSGGLYGGMWEPMLFQANMDTVHQMLIDETTARKCVERGTIRHTLSHRKLVIDVCQTRLRPAAKPLPPALVPSEYEQTRWFDDSSLSRIGLSTLANKIMKLRER